MSMAGYYEELFQKHGVPLDTSHDLVGDLNKPCDRCEWPMTLMFMDYRCNKCDGLVPTKDASEGHWHREPMGNPHDTPSGVQPARARGWSLTWARGRQLFHGRLDGSYRPGIIKPVANGITYDFDGQSVAGALHTEDGVDYWLVDSGIGPQEWGRADWGVKHQATPFPIYFNGPSVFCNGGRLLTYKISEILADPNWGPFDTHVCPSTGAKAIVWKP